MGASGLLVLYSRAWRRANYRRKFAKTAWDSIRYYISAPGFVRRMIRNALSLAGLLLMAGSGAIVGGWITNKQDPVQFLSRKVLTPVVRPGDDVKIELDNYRLLRCPQKTYRIINKPDGERSTQDEDKPAGFGKLGRDKYITSIATQASAPFGKATIYSYTVRMCNPWEWLFPVEYGEAWVDTFEFGPETKRISSDQARNSLVK